VRRLLVATLYFEVGLVLVIVPWLPFWDRNYFAEALPFVDAVMTNNFVRGAVSGLGIVDVGVAISEVVAIFAARRLQDSIITIGRSSALEE
jgi:hypothetical protein